MAHVVVKIGKNTVESVIARRRAEDLTLKNVSSPLPKKKYR